MRRLMAVLGGVAALALVTAGEPDGEAPLFNGYERPKNGPPLTGIFHKAGRAWILAKLTNPLHHPAARMPDFEFSQDEALDIMAYLKSVATDPPAPVGSWPAWAGKGIDEMDDDEFDAMTELSDKGKAVWSNARCSICHSINGPRGEIIGGFVDLRVGGIDLQIAGDKLKREWLYAWIKDPKDYFALTLMPRFRLGDGEIRALVEYILRDDAFRAPPADGDEESEDEEDDEDGEETGDEEARSGLWKLLDEPGRAAKGRKLVELSRCVVCHEIKGIAELLPQPAQPPPPRKGTFEWLAYDIRCLTCHTIEGRGGAYAPDLTSAGSRLHPEWIAQFVAAPDLVRPLSQQMPRFKLAPEEAQVVAAYMGKSRLRREIPAVIPGGPVAAEEVDRGREAFRARGCIACHTVGDGPGGAVGPDLAAVGDRQRPGHLWYHLKNPHATNPYSAEPDYGLSDQEARELAAFLATKKGKK